MTHPTVRDQRCSRSAPEKVRCTLVYSALADLPAGRAGPVRLDGRLGGGGVMAGGGGVLTVLPDADPGGARCSSTRTELVALRTALSDFDVTSADQPVII